LPLSDYNDLSCNKSECYGLCPLSLYQRFEKKKKSKILYSPESIKIRFISRQNPQDFGGSKSPALSERGRGEQTRSSKNFEFVSLKTAAELKRVQTFDIILPNLIHKSKKRNLT